MNQFSFAITATDPKSRARLGTIVTPHGTINTPAFVPVGTQATVKSLTPEELSTLGVQLFFVNTYHTYLRPGLSVIEQCGGLHNFMGWRGPIITDSGGFQVFSLGGKKLINVAISESAVLDRERFTQRMSRHEGQHHQVFPDDYKPVGELVAIDEDGVTFTSHWDGTKHRFTPERSIEIQHTLGSDIMIAFDECTLYPATPKYAKKALDRTHRWAQRSLDAHKTVWKDHAKAKKPYQALYGVVQGSVYEDLRKESARIISAMDFDGIAIGGVSVGESKAEMQRVLQWVGPLLPEEKPRHLLGVGEIDDIFVLVEHGMDTFDCVQPTRLARMGKLYVPPSSDGDYSYMIDITKEGYTKDMSSIDPACSCYTCSHFSRAYLHHLFRVRELLSYRLASIHNIHFVTQLVSDIRAALEHGTFLEMKQKWLYNR